MRKKASGVAGATAFGQVVVCVKLPDGQTASFSVEPATSIGTICSFVAERRGISENRVNLKYSGKTLNKANSVSYLGVREETVLKVQILEIKRINVNVTCPGDRSVAVCVENVSSLRHVTDALEIQLSVPAHRQVLKLRGRTLANLNERCVDAGITDNCTITMELKPEAAACQETQEQKSTEPAFDKEAVLNSFEVSEGKNIEVAFSFDTTGSMYPCLAQVRTKLRNTVTRLIEEIPGMRIALIAHGDYCDHDTSYVVNTLDFTNDVTALVNFAETAGKTGGGDSPECYEWVLREASQLDWSENSAKALVVIGDDIPHPPSMTDQNVFWKHEMQLLKAQGIKIYGVRALNNKSAQPFYESLAEYTGGAYVEFANFSVITEMFLAVCYKMAGEEQYNDFCEEVEQAVNHGHVANDVMQVLQQIDQAKTDENEIQQQEEFQDRWHIQAAWWDPDNYGYPAHPTYTYDSQTRKWAKYQHQEQASYEPGAFVPPAGVKSSPRKVLPARAKSKAAKKSCCVM